VHPNDSEALAPTAPQVHQTHLKWCLLQVQNAHAAIENRNIKEATRILEEIVNRFVQLNDETT